MIVGIDMGGTNIDGVLIEDGRIINSIKNPTNKDNLFSTIYSALTELLDGYDKSKIKRINLSTTVSTNAIVEKKTSPVGMIIEPGPGAPYDNLACGEANAFLSGYIDHRGNVIEKLDYFEIEEICRKFKRQGMEACGVVSKFSTRNPQHEISIMEAIKDSFFPITMGHTMSGKLNFPRRVFTSYLNSAVYSTFNKFSTNIKKSLEQEGINAAIYILKADGGTMTINSAEQKPVETILSGPAASFMGISALLPADKDAILMDIGGTTTDIFFLADGVPLFEPLGSSIGEYKTLVRSIYSVSIGLGGDSAIDFMEGKIKIGPQRDGMPFAFGGPKPTPTDAMITLKLMPAETENAERAYKAMALLSQKLNLSVEDTAKHILESMGTIIKEKVDSLLQQINSHPVYTIKELLYGKKVNPKLINIIGGPAKALTPTLREKFQLPCYYPENYLVANAVGAALARPTMEISMHVDTARKTLLVPELDLYEKVSSRFNLDMAKEKALNLITEYADFEDIGDIDAEITEESSFNMVRGFLTTGRDIRVKAQIRPGLIQELRGDNNA